MFDDRFLNALADPRAKVLRIHGSTLEAQVGSCYIKVVATPWLQTIRKIHGSRVACDVLIALCLFSQERGFEPTQDNETLFLTLLNSSN